MKTIVCLAYVDEKNQQQHVRLLSSLRTPQTLRVNVVTGRRTCSEALTPNPRYEMNDLSFFFRTQVRICATQMHTKINA